MEMKFLRLGNKWQRRFLISSSRPDLGSWLQCKKGPFRLGCIVCEAGKAKGAFANFRVNDDFLGKVVDSHMFTMHESGKKHKALVTQMLGGGSSDDGMPSATEFQRVLDASRAGSASHACGIDGVGKRKKSAKCDGAWRRR